MRALSPVVLLLLAAAACAHAPAASGPASAPSAQAVVVTGSHVPQAVNPQTGTPSRSAWLRTYGKGELAASGEANIGSALKKLEPADY